MAPFDAMEEAVQAGWDALNLQSGPMSYLAVTGGLARHFLAAHPGSPLGQAMGERMGGLGLCFFSGRSGAVQRRVEDTTAALLNAGAIDALAVEGEGPKAARQWRPTWMAEDSQPVLALR